MYYIYGVSGPSLCIVYRLYDAHIQTRVSASVSLCPIPISETIMGTGASLLSFGTVVEPAVMPDPTVPSNSLGELL